MEYSLEAYAIYKNYGSVTALTNVDVRVRPGEFFTLLGPSGCGKTTLLRIIAGLEMPDSGTIMLRGNNLTSLPARERNVNTVFQNYALFPHLSVADNVAFGLRSRKFPEEVIGSKVHAALDMVHMTEFAARMPDQLSGGQQQRVAMARALVNEPEILLLDEPMSALDAKLRTTVQEELRQLQQRLGITSILVTHDQDEALTVSDRIAVMNKGQFVQVGTPMEIYERPCNRFVANFLGKANIIEATRAPGGVQSELGFLQVNGVDWETGYLAIRPERVRLRDEAPSVNGVQSRVRDAFYRGDHLDIWLEAGNLRLRTAPHRAISSGDTVWVELPAEALVVLHD
jgi:spermidine/putrescine transport system ATP-binding protein